LFRVGRWEDLVALTSNGLKDLLSADRGIGFNGMCQLRVFHKNSPHLKNGQRTQGIDCGQVESIAIHEIVRQKRTTPRLARRQTARVSGASTSVAISCCLAAQPWLSLRDTACRQAPLQSARD